MELTTQYIIINRNEYNIEQEIVIGENNFRRHILDHIQDYLKFHECTSNDINEFLAHHDASYFSEEFIEIYEKIIKQHLADSKVNEDYKHDEIPYQPDIVPWSQFYISKRYLQRRCKHKLTSKCKYKCKGKYRYDSPVMMRMNKEEIVKYISFTKKTTEELICYMTEWNNDTHTSIWANVLVVNGNNINIETY